MPETAEEVAAREAAAAEAAAGGAAAAAGTAVASAEGAAAAAGTAAAIASGAAAAASLDAGERMRNFEQRSEEWRGKTSQEIGTLATALAETRAELGSTREALTGLASLTSSMAERLQSTQPASTTVDPKTTGAGQGSDADESQDRKTKPRPRGFIFRR